MRDLPCVKGWGEDVSRLGLAVVDEMQQGRGCKGGIIVSLVATNDAGCTEKGLKDMVLGDPTAVQPRALW